VTVTQERIDLLGPFQELRRTTGAGTKSRVTVEIESKPLLFHFDDNRLGAGPALAIAKAITRGIRSIAEQVSATTSARRERSRQNPNTKSYQRRYSGGRTGLKPPGTGDQWGVDSGRLADGIHVRQNPTQATYTVNVPENRLNQSLFGAGFEAFLQKLYDLVPQLRPEVLLEDPEVRAAIEQAIDAVVQGSEERARAALEAARRAREELVRKAIEVGVQIATSV
jgi:hypothetical protein